MGENEIDQLPDVAQVQDTIAQLLRSDHASTLLEEAETVVDDMIAIEQQFRQILATLILVDALQFVQAVKFTGNARPNFTNMFNPLYAKYLELMMTSRKAATDGLDYCNTYMKVIIPIVLNPSVSKEEKMKNIQHFIDLPRETEKKAREFADGFKRLQEDLLRLADALNQFSHDVGDQLNADIEETKKKIEDLKNDLDKYRKQAQKAFPSPEDAINGVNVLSILGVGGKVITSIAAGSGKTAGALGASGSAGAASAVSIAAPIAVVAYLGIGIYIGIRLHSAIEGLMMYAKTTTAIVLKQLLLAKLVKDAATAVALKTLVASVTGRILDVSNRLSRLVNVWDVVRQDARGIVDLLSDASKNTSMAELERLMFIALAWYQRLYDILKILSQKTQPKPPQPTDIDAKTLRKKSAAALEMFRDYLSAKGTKGFFPQGKDWCPTKPFTGVPPKEPRLEDFQDLVDGTCVTCLDNTDPNLRDLALNLAGLNECTQFVYPPPGEEGMVVNMAFTEGGGNNNNSNPQQNRGFPLLPYNSPIADGNDVWGMLRRFARYQSGFPFSQHNPYNVNRWCLPYWRTGQRGAFGAVTFMTLRYFLMGVMVGQMFYMAKDKVGGQIKNTVMDSWEKWWKGRGGNDREGGGGGGGAMSLFAAHSHPVEQTNTSSDQQSMDSVDLKVISPDLGASLPAAQSWEKNVQRLASDISQRLEGRIEDNIQMSLQSELDSKDELAQHIILWSTLPAAEFWQLYEAVATTGQFNIVQHLWALNLIQLLILTPVTSIVIPPAKLTELESSLAEALTLAQEPLYCAENGSTSIRSAFVYAQYCHQVPVILIARCIQRVLIALYPDVRV